MDHAQPARRPVATWLLAGTVLVLMLACLAVGYVALTERTDRAEAGTAQARYSAASAAAREHIDQLVDLRYNDPAAFESLAAGATERLAERYSATDSPLVKAVRSERSVSEGEVVGTGVVEIVGDTATVLVATTGSVTSRATDRRPEERDLRFRVDLVQLEGAWLVDDIEVLR